MTQDLGSHYRSELKITAWQGEIPLAEPPIEVRGFVPIAVQDGSDPRLRAEVLKLVAEALLDLADLEENKINNTKENA